MEKQSSFTCLMDTCKLISSSLDLSEILRTVTRTSKDLIKAEAGSLMLIDNTTNKLNFAVALGSHGNKLKKEFSLDIGQGIAGWVAETGEPVIVPDVEKDKRFYQKPDKTTAFKTKSILAVPLKTKDKIIGTLELMNPEDKAGFSEENIPLFQAFACQIAVAIENARMHKRILEQKKLEQELAIASELQNSILSEKILQKKWISIKSEYMPARKIGGDFYDIIDLKDKILVVIGDVSGKGVPAALCMVRILTHFRILARYHSDISVIANKLNNILRKHSIRGMFATAIIIAIPRGSANIEIVNAGHPDPIISFNNKSDIMKTKRGIPLGILDNFTYPLQKIKYREESLLLFTDGIIEARNEKGEEFGVDRVIDIMTKSGNNSDMPDELIASIKSFSKNTYQHDDLTVIYINKNEHKKRSGQS